MSIGQGVSRGQHLQKGHFLYLFERPLLQFCTSVQTVIVTGASATQLDTGGISLPALGPLIAVMMVQISHSVVFATIALVVTVLSSVSPVTQVCDPWYYYGFPCSSDMLRWEKLWVADECCLRDKFMSMLGLYEVNVEQDNVQANSNAACFKDHQHRHFCVIMHFLTAYQAHMWYTMWSLKTWQLLWLDLTDFHNLCIVLIKNKKYVLWNVYLPNVVRCIPYTVIEIFDYNCNDFELGRFKVIDQGQRSWCQLIDIGWFPIWLPLTPSSYLSPFRNIWRVISVTLN